MRNVRELLPFAVLIGCTLAGGAIARAGEPSAKAPPDADVEFLRSAGVDADSQFLLRYLRERAIESPNPGLVERLVQQLGAERQVDRDRASCELVRLWKFSRERLRRAAHDRDPEVAARARDCLKQIERQQKPGV